MKPCPHCARLARYGISACRFHMSRSRNRRSRVPVTGRLRRVGFGQAPPKLP